MRLLEVGRQDVEAHVLTEQTLYGVLVSEAEGVTFALSGGPVDPRGSYAVNVHVDMRGDGRIRKGDFVTVQSYPVLTFGAPRHVVVEVRQV